MTKWLVTLEKKNGNKYLVLDDADENKEVSQKYEEVWNGIKIEIETINCGKKLNMVLVPKKLGSSLMMICHWIDLQSYTYWQ